MIVETATKTHTTCPFLNAKLLSLDGYLCKWYCDGGGECDISSSVEDRRDQKSEGRFAEHSDSVKTV